MPTLLKMPHYTGVGSRTTPQHILTRMTKVAEALRACGFILRSGGADGADDAFEDGAGDFSEIYVPWDGFGKRGNARYDSYHHSLEHMPVELVDEAKAIARSVMGEPHWNNLSQGAEKLHTRNVFEVLGRDLKSLSVGLLYWCPRTKEGYPTGGTRTAILLAHQYGIPTLHFDDYPDGELILGMDVARVARRLSQNAQNSP